MKGIGQIMKRNTDKLSAEFKKDEANVKRESVHFDDRLHSELTPKPSGRKFYKLFVKFFGKEVSDALFCVSPLALNFDPNVYEAMDIAVVTSLSNNGSNKNEDLKFLQSDAMESLKDNTYHRDHENNSRKIAYDYLKNTLL